MNSLSSKGCRLDIDVEEGVALQLHQLANQGARLDRIELKDVWDKVSQTLKRDVRRRWTQWCWDRCGDKALSNRPTLKTLGPKILFFRIVEESFSGAWHSSILALVGDLLLGMVLLKEVTSLTDKMNLGEA